MEELATFCYNINRCAYCVQNKSEVIFQRECGDPKCSYHRHIWRDIDGTVGMYWGGSRTMFNGKVCDACAKGNEEWYKSNRLP